MRRLGGTFSRLLDELVRERTGLASSRRHDEVKERVLSDAMARAGVSDEAVYLALLKRDRKTYDDLIADLTVPETYFFRDPPHYELLRLEVLPAILRAHHDSHVLELWSAGCASGEEPYSLAILLEQERLGTRSNVLGSDVSYRALARALRGVYSRWSLRATSARDRDRYFASSGSEYQLIPRIRARPRFVQHSLSSPVYPAPASRTAGFDLILCRNVLIYFDPQSIAEATQRLARSLNEGGWLMTGPSDPMLELTEWCDAVPTPCGMLYHRRHTGAHARASSVCARAPEPRASMTQHAWHSQASGTRRVREPSESPVSALATSAPRAVSTADDAALGAARHHASPEALVARAAMDARSREPAVEVDPVEQVRALEREHGSLVAEAGCRDLLASRPLSAGLHVVHAMLLVDLGRDALAELAVRRALYLDRSLLIAQLVGATLCERRGDRAAAGLSYAQLGEACRARPNDEPVMLGDGLTHATLGALAMQRARALAGERNQTRQP